MKNNFDLMEENEISAKSNGGTERIKRKLYNGEIPRDLLERVQIVFSREREVDYSKHRIFYAHDLHDDPEAKRALGNKGWQKYHALVFVSNWQAQKYIDYYEIPPSKCHVMLNFIDPSKEEYNKPTDKIKLIYHSTPHRGLEILYPVFCELCKIHDNIELDVYSSFKLYGWGERDKQYEELFYKLDAHPKINNHGTVSNEEIRKALSESHIFAYPSIWPETSCICLMEAMAEKNLCVHPNYGALYETGANWTLMYDWNENMAEHAGTFMHNMNNAINFISYCNEDPKLKVLMDAQKFYTNLFYTWETRKAKWISLLESILSMPLEIKKQEPMFVYRTT